MTLTINAQRHGRRTATLDAAARVAALGGHVLILATSPAEASWWRMRLPRAVVRVVPLPFEPATQCAHGRPDYLCHVCSPRGRQ